MAEGDLSRNSQESLVWVGPPANLAAWNTQDLVSTAFRHKRTLLACFGAIILLSVLAALLKPREYEAQAKILLKHERSDPLVSAGVQQIESSDRTVTSEEINSEVELVRSDDLLRRVVIACGLAKASHDGRTTERNVALAMARLRSQLKVAVIRKTNVLSISYRSRSPDRSAAVLRSVLNTYLDKHVATHSASDELEFFDQQVDHYKGELAKADEALSRFAQKDGAVSPSTQRDAALQRATDFDASLQTTNSAIVETKERIRMLGTEAARTPARLTTQLKSADNPQLIQDLKATMLRLQQKRTELLSKFQSNYRPVVEVDQEIANAKMALSSAQSTPLRDKTTDVNPIRQWIDSELNKARADLAALQSKAQSTAHTVESYQQQARNLDEQRLRHEELERNAKSAEDNYLLYVRKREDARITGALDQRRILNVTVIDPVLHPALAISAKPYYLLFGVVLASVLTAGLLFAMHRADNTFRTPRQIEEFLQIPVLATVPLERWLPPSPRPNGARS
jgi:uncharacterized protein involved in exopolysaccharide biosynthesis